MMIVWLFIKSAFSRIIPFIAEHWRVILIVLICLYAFYQKTRYEATVQELDAMRDNIAQATTKQAHENEIKRIKSESYIKSAQLEHSKEIEAIKHEHEKQNKLSNITIADLRNKLRQSVSDSFNLPEVDTNSIGTAESWRNSYTTLAGHNEALKQGCAITTADYNLLRGWADSACLQVGCE